MRNIYFSDGSRIREVDTSGTIATVVGTGHMGYTGGSELQEIVCKLFKVEPEKILRRTKMSSASEARALFCYIGVRMIGVKGTEVGKFVGMGTSGVSRAITRREQILRAIKH